MGHVFLGVVIGSFIYYLIYDSGLIYNDDDQQNGGR